MQVSLTQVGLVVGIATPVVTGLFYSIRAFWRLCLVFYKMSDDIADFKANHFPHIDYALREICRKLGIEYLDLGEGSFEHDKAFEEGIMRRARDKREHK
jgi:hypothetical protein